MTKEKAMEILNKAFDSIFDEIKSEIRANKVDVEQEILMSQNVERIRSLAAELDTIDKALSSISRREDAVHEAIANEYQWYDYSLLCELKQAFSWLPKKEDEAE